MHPSFASSQGVAAMSMPQRRKFRPQLECLEDRLAPAKFTVTTKLDVVDDNDGKISLREAITKANQSSGADTVVLGQGVYLMQLAGLDSNNVAGDFDIFGGSLTLRGAGAGKTVIDAQQLNGVFQVIGSTPSSIRVVFQGLTIRNGLRTSTFGGGGILVSNADLVIRDSVITGNRTSGPGGGISNKYGPGTGNVTLIRSTVSGNVSGDDGGGIYVRAFGSDPVPTSTLTLSKCTVRRNIADLSGGGIWAGTANLTSSTVSGNAAGFFGGGIYASTANLTNSTVSGNTAGTAGGGIWASTANLTNSTVSGNTAGRFAGGIDAGTANLTNSTVSGNTAGTRSGGIAAGTANLTNSTVSGNTAGTEGGGIWALRGSFLNSTIAENIAATGGGIYRSGTSGTFSVKNTLIALNLVAFGGTGPAVNGEFTSLGHNLIGDGSGNNDFGINFDILGTTANPIDPKLGALKSNGGRTKTHGLLAGSPAINAGDNNVVDPISGQTLKTDQRGAPFKRKVGPKVDIGAFERQ
jgi:hypothetical protein